MIASELQVYRDSYDMIGIAIDLTKNYPKMYKYTIGQKIIDTSLYLFEYIQLANMYKENRATHLNGFIVKFEVLKTLLRFSKDKKLISVSQFASISMRIDKIGKQISAWKNSSGNCAR